MTSKKRIEREKKRKKGKSMLSTSFSPLKLKSFLLESLESIRKINVENEFTESCNIMMYGMCCVHV